MSHHDFLERVQVSATLSAIPGCDVAHGSSSNRIEEELGKASESVLPLR